MIDDNTLIKIAVVLAAIAFFELSFITFFIVGEIPPRIDPHAIEYLTTCTKCVVY